MEGKYNKLRITKFERGQMKIYALHTPPTTLLPLFSLYRTVSLLRTKFRNGRLATIFKNS